MQYFVPGFIFIEILAFYNSFNLSFSKLSLWSMAISYFFTVITSGILSIFCISVSVWIYYLCPLLLSVILGHVLTRFVFQSDSLKSFLRFMGNKSQYSNAWMNLIDFNPGTALKVVMREKQIGYIGRLVLIEERSLDSWFALYDYCMVNPLTNSVILDTTIKENGENVNQLIALNLRDIESVELFYNKDSKVFARLVNSQV